MSISKDDAVKLGIFNNTLFFPFGPRKAVVYSRHHENATFRWYNEIGERYLAPDLVRKGYDYEEVRRTLDLISRCSSEIVREVIEQFKNFVDNKVLVCLVTAAYILSIKFTISDDVVKYRNSFFANLVEDCGLKNINSIERYILKHTDWRGCSKTLRMATKEIYGNEEKIPPPRMDFIRKLPTPNGEGVYNYFINTFDPDRKYRNLIDKLWETGIAQKDYLFMNNFQKTLPGPSPLLSPDSATSVDTPYYTYSDEEKD